MSSMRHEIEMNGGSTFSFLSQRIDVIVGSKYAHKSIFSKIILLKYDHF